MDGIDVLLIVGAAFFLALIGIPIGAKILGKDLTPGWAVEEVTGPRLDAPDRRSVDRVERSAVLIAFLSHVIATLIVVPVLWTALWALAALASGTYPSAAHMFQYGLRTAGIVFVQLMLVGFLRAAKRRSPHAPVQPAARPAAARSSLLLHDLPQVRIRNPLRVRIVHSRLSGRFQASALRCLPGR
jgi:hypothetical protein